MPPSATGSPTETTCRPDAYGLYSSQTTYTTSLDVFNLPAPPRTKHGIGSAETDSNAYGAINGLAEYV